MKFEPDVSEWTDEQLEETRTQTLQDMADVQRIFAVDDNFLLPVYNDILNTIETEITERGLKLEKS